MPALTNNNSATRTKLRGVGPAHVTPVSALKAQRNGEQPPASVRPETDTSSPAVLKAVREFEYGRQRTKRAADTERMRERKERKRRGGAAPRAVRPTHSGHARKVDMTGAEDVEDADERDGDGENYPLNASQTDLREDPAGIADLDVSASQQISLEAFIKPAKLHKRKAEDFEVIPKVRSVIALDDHAPPPLPEVDEAWEHVTLDDEHDLAPSYAQVVSTAA